MFIPEKTGFKMMGKFTPKSSRSLEFIQGYNACATGISRTRNPFPVPPLAYVPDDPPSAWSEWRAGWNKRFYGERIESEPWEEQCLS